MEVNLKELEQVLQNEPFLYLATSADNRVTVRPMSYINNGLTIYCFTLDTSTKAQQLHQNPSAAISVGNFQLEAKARFLGHPNLPENQEIKEIYFKKFGEDFSGKNPQTAGDIVFIAFDIKEVSQWVFEDAEPIGFAKKSL